MNVYLEYIFLDNFALNAFLLTVTLLFRKEKLSVIRLLISSAVGGIFSVVYPFIGSYNYIVKLLLAPLMIFIAAKVTSIRKYLLNLVVFLLFSFVLAGIVLFLSYFTEVDFNDYDGDLQLYPFCILGSCALLASLAGYIYVNAVKRKNRDDCICEVTVLAETPFTVSAYYDSGNKLTESGYPVVIVGREIFDRLDGEVGDIPIRTVKGIGVLKCKRIAFSFIGEEEIIEAIAGLSDDLKGEYKMILNCDTMQNTKIRRVENESISKEII